MLFLIKLFTLFVYLKNSFVFLCFYLKTNLCYYFRTLFSFENVFTFLLKKLSNISN